MLLLSSSETHGQIVAEGGKYKGQNLGWGGGEDEGRLVVFRLPRRFRPLYLTPSAIICPRVMG